MRGFDRPEYDDAGIVFRDLITLALCGFVVCVVLILPHINPAKATRTTEGSAPPGNVLDVGVYAGELMPKGGWYSLD